MIDGLRPYPEMKPTGLPWLGDVPAHWDVRRIKYAFCEVDNRSTTGDETHLSMSQRLGLVPASQVEKSLVSESYIGGKLVETERSCPESHEGPSRHIRVCEAIRFVSPDYAVLRPAARANVRSSSFVLKSPACSGRNFGHARKV